MAQGRGEVRAMKCLRPAAMRWMVATAFVAILQSGMGTHGNAQALPGDQPAGVLSPSAATGMDSDPLKSDSADRAVTMPAAGV